MVDPRDGYGLAALLEEATPAHAMAVIEDRLLSLDLPRRPSLRETVIAGLEDALDHGARIKADWFEFLLEDPVPSADGSSGDLPLEDAPVREARLCRLLLAALDDMGPEERGRRIGTAARHAADISLLCASIAAAERERDGSYLGEALPDVRKVLLDRVGALAATSAFWAQRFPAALLWFWFAHGEEQRVYLFTRHAMDDPSGLAALLTVPLERVGAGEEQQDIVAVRRWSRILDFQALEARAVKLAMSAPSRAERRRARRFLDAFGAGKSELFR
jgi:hypothetical protein